MKIILNSYMEGVELSSVLSLGGTDLPGILLLAVSFWRQMMFKNIQVSSHEQNNECNLNCKCSSFSIKEIRYLEESKGSHPARPALLIFSTQQPQFLSFISHPVGL